MCRIEAIRGLAENRNVGGSIPPLGAIPEQKYEPGAFLSSHAAVYNSFNVQRHLISATTHRAFRATAMNTWREAAAS
jgi:hypothetical protein